MKAITTRYFGPTNTRPARIIATDMDGNNYTVGTDMATDNYTTPHRTAAYGLAEKMKWPGKLVGGSVKGAMVWVFVDSND